LLSMSEQKLQAYRKELNMLNHNSKFWAEIKILSYLETYKITREDDLTMFAAQTLKKPSSYIQRILDRMVKEKKIKKIIHDRIEPKKIYYEGSHLGAGIDHSLWLLSGLDSMGELESYSKSIKNELDKAEAKS
jgi:predicted transposase YdaD